MVRLGSYMQLSYPHSQLRWHIVWWPILPWFKLGLELSLLSYVEGREDRGVHVQCVHLH